MSTKSKPLPAYAVWHELRQFISQTALNLTACDDRGFSLHRFKDGTNLIAELPDKSLPDALKRFASEAATFIETHESRIDWEGSGGPAIDGTGIERHIISHALWNLVGPGLEDTFTKDIIGILSFLSQTSQRRYEKATPQITIEFDATSRVATHYGVLGKPLLDEYRALLRLCRDAHTILLVQGGLEIVDILDDIRATTAADAGELPSVPPRLAHLQQRTSLKRNSIIFNLNENGSQEIIARGSVVFRQVDGRWRFMLLDEALKTIRQTMGSRDGSVARNALMLALELADAGEGAVLFLCESATDEVLEHLFIASEGLIQSGIGIPYHELSARTRFTELVGRRQLSLKSQSFSYIKPLLRDVCGIDGATVFSYEGELVGFGCLVRQRPSQNNTPAAEGARTTAARAVSLRGISIKVSSDGTANLFTKGREWGVLW